MATHALLQPDVKFHNLGLLVIDEEHKFGVDQKEVVKADNTGMAHILFIPSVQQQYEHRNRYSDPVCYSSTSYVTNHQPTAEGDLPDDQCTPGQEGCGDTPAARQQHGDDQEGHRQ